MSPIAADAETEAAIETAKIEAPKPTTEKRYWWIAAGMAAVYPGAVAISVLVLSEAAFCALMLLQFVLWAAAYKAASWRRAAWT